MVFRLRKPPPPPHKKAPPPYSGEIWNRGGLSYPKNPPKAENFGDLSLEMMVFLRKIASEECEKQNFRLRRAKTVKGLKTMSKSAAGEKILGVHFFG